uniref:Uncharacterized protein n=1 Tax=Glossina pallidipes TaxID=7398 RepID=A0A1A9ZBV1_GLOPL
MDFYYNQIRMDELFMSGGRNKQREDIVSNKGWCVIIGLQTSNGSSGSPKYDIYILTIWCYVVQAIVTIVNLSFRKHLQVMAYTVGSSNDVLTGY